MLKGHANTVLTVYLIIFYERQKLNCSWSGGFPMTPVNPKPA